MRLESESNLASLYWLLNLRLIEFVELFFLNCARNDEKFFCPLQGESKKLLETSNSFLIHPVPALDDHKLKWNCGKTRRGFRLT